jgi:hypothetical protein
LHNFVWTPSTLRVNLIFGTARMLIVKANNAFPLCNALWLGLVVSIGCFFNFGSRTAIAKEKVEICSSGSITLGSFTDHIDQLRRSSRYAPEAIAKLVADERDGGPEFFSSQVVIKGEQSSSGDYDLNLFQGFSDSHAKYRSLMAWACASDDYPIAYFVGFKVGEIRDGAIFVSREKGVVNVISLKKIDPDLDKHTSVRDLQSRLFLCEDIGAGCIKGIFYGNY